MLELIEIASVILITSLIIATFITACIDYIMTKHKGGK